MDTADQGQGVLHRGLVAVGRVPLMAAGAAAVLWCAVVLRPLWWDAQVVTAAHSIMADHDYVPAKLDAMIAESETGGDPLVRASVASAVAVMRLRAAEIAMRAAEGSLDSRLDALRSSVNRALAVNPGDAFLWLARFWATNTREGFRPDHEKDLRASYRFGPHEAWIALRRNPMTLALAAALSPDLSEAAMDEFVKVVRSGLVADAAATFMGLGSRSREAIVARLKSVDRASLTSFQRALGEQDDRIGAVLRQSESPFVAMDKLIDEAARPQQIPLLDKADAPKL